jgi:hypothetical protein
VPADHLPQRVRCTRCFGVVWTTHPWERVSCCCGAVTVSGTPWRPRIDWMAGPPGGWSFVDEAWDEDEDESNGDSGTATSAEA